MNRKHVIVLVLCIGLCFGVFSFSPVYAADNTHTTATYSVVSDDVSLYLTAMDGMLEFTNFDSAYYSGNASYVWSGVVREIVHVSLTVRNRSSSAYKTFDTNNFTITLNINDRFDTAAMCKVIENSDNVDVWSISTGGSPLLTTINFRYTGDPTLTPSQQIYLSFDLCYECPFNYSVSSSNWAIVPWGHSWDNLWNQNIISSNTNLNMTGVPTFTTRTASEYDSSPISGILGRILQAINGDKPAYTEVQPQSEAVSSSASDVQEDLDAIHTQEMSYYNSNATAIEASGLSNYQFSQSQISGLTGVKNLFGSLWTSLGNWTLIYTFVLSLSLATFMLRHRPATRQSTKYQSKGNSS